MARKTNGRYKCKHGYVRIKVPKTHPAAFKNQGWAYEHVVVAVDKIGRPLKDGEVVHHINGDKSDNRPENLRVVSEKFHKYLHREHDHGLRNPGEPNPYISCACGCGQLLLKYDDIGRPRTRIYGHWNNVWETPTRNLVIEILSNGPKTAKEINKIFGRDVYTSLNYFMKLGLIKRIKHGTYALT